MGFLNTEPPSSTKISRVLVQLQCFWGLPILSADSVASMYSTSPPCTRYSLVANVPQYDVSHVLVGQVGKISRTTLTFKMGDMNLFCMWRVIKHYLFLLYQYDHCLVDFFLTSNISKTTFCPNSSGPFPPSIFFKSTFTEVLVYTETHTHTHTHTHTIQWRW